MSTNHNDLTEKVPLPYLLTGVFLVGIFVGAGGLQTSYELNQNPFQCYMSSPDGECVVKISDNYPDPYAKHCITQGNQSNSSACFLTDAETEYLNFFRTSRNVTELSTSRKVNVVDRKLNASGYGTIYVSEFYSLVKNKTEKFQPSAIYTQIEKTYGGKINVTECGYNQSRNGC